MTDEEIINKYFAREEDAISETDKKYGAYCRRLCFNILMSREDSEECVSDTYMKLWNTIPPKRPPELGAYISRVAKNTALNSMRNRDAEKRGGGMGAVDYEEIKECLPSAESVEDSYDGKAALSSINRFLEKLPRTKMLIFVKRYWYFCTISDIADEMGMTENNVKKILQRTREKLRIHLEQEGISI